MAEDCSSALIVRKEIEDKFLNALDGDTKSYFDEIDKNMEKAHKQGSAVGLERVKIEKDGLVMWFDVNDYGGYNLYRNQDIENALADVADESDWALLCAPIDIYPLGYDMESNGDLVDEATEIFGLYLNNSITYSEHGSIECIFFNENYMKPNGEDLSFMALFLTDNAFSEISGNKDAMNGISGSAFAHFKNAEEDSHMILFLNSSDQNPGMGALMDTIHALDDEEYDLVIFTQAKRSYMTDEFQTSADMTPDIYGEAGLTGDFDFIIAQALCYDVPEDIILGKKGDEPDKKSKPDSQIQNNSASPGNLKELVLDIYEEMRAFPSPYGFHFSYSPESSWNGNADFLIMTINPSASDGHGKAKKVVPGSPWPGVNDFFDPKNKFAIQKPVQSICYELSRLSDNPVCRGTDPLEAAQNFADNCAILSSFVPFRTKDAGEITNEMKEFANTKYWGELFTIWQPKVIVTIGNPPFAAMQDFLKARYAQTDSNEEKITETSKLAYRMAHYQKPDGDGIMLLGLPHPTAFGEKGFPTNFPENTEDDSPLRAFLTRFIKNVEKDCQRHNRGNAGEATADIIRKAQEARKAKRRES